MTGSFFFIKERDVEQIKERDDEQIKERGDEQIKDHKNMLQILMFFTTYLTHLWMLRS